MNALAEKSASKLGRLLLYYVLAFALTWLFWLSAIALQRTRFPATLPRILLLIGTFGPFAAAVWVESVEGGRQRVASLIKQAFRWRLGWPLFALALFLPILVAGLSNRVAGGTVTPVRPLVFLGTFVLYFFLGGSVAEEFGWRGIAWPRLRNRYGPFVAAIVVGLLWACWHLPLFYVSGTTQSTTPFAYFALGCVGMSAIMGWAYDHSDASILPALFFHTSWNTSTLLFPPFVNDKHIDPTALPSSILFLAVGVPLTVWSSKQQRQ